MCETNWRAALARALVWVAEGREDVFANEFHVDNGIRAGVVEADDEEVAARLYLYIADHRQYTDDGAALHESAAIKTALNGMRQAIAAASDQTDAFEATSLASLSRLDVEGAASTPAVYEGMVPVAEQTVVPGAAETERTR